MKSPVYFLFLFLFSANIAAAQFWVKTEGPYGGGTFLGSLPNGKLFASGGDYSSTPLYFTSTDDAKTWQKMPVQPPASAFHVGADGNLFSWKTDKLYRSSDEGASWSLVNSDDFWSSNAQVFSKPDGKLFAARSNDFYRSDDGGTTWEHVYDFSATASFVDDFYSDPYSNDLFAYWSEGSPDAFHVFRSSDGGSSWNEIFTSNNYFYYPQNVLTTPEGYIFITGDDEARIHRSTDGGNSWQTLVVSPDESLEAVGLARTATGRLLCTVWYKSYFSDDNGNSWELLPGNWAVLAQQFFGLPNGLTLAFPSSIWRSTDDGMSWEFGSTGMPFSYVESMAVKNDQEIYATTLDGLFKTADGGNTWQLLMFITADNYYKKVALDEQGTLFYTTETTCWRSTDGGATFTDVSPPFQGWETIENLATTPGGKVFLSTFSGLWKSDDSGATWTDLGGNIPSSFQRIEQHPDGYLVASFYWTFYKSTDGGDTWTEHPAPFNSYGEDFGIGAQGQIFTGGDYYFYWSNDGCLTWDSVLVSPDSFDLFFPEAFAVNGAGHIFSSSTWTEGVRRSIDGGLSWNFLPLIPNTYASTSLLEISPSQRLFANTSGNGIWKTADPTATLTYATGKLWQDLEAPACSPSLADSLFRNLPIRAEKAGGQTVFGYANDLAMFLLPVEAGSYEVKAVPPSPYWYACPTPLDVPQSALQTTIDSVDVRIQAVVQCPWMEVEIAAAFLRRCFPGSYVVRWCNKGTVAAENASVTVTLDSFLVFTSASISPASVVGNEISFSLGNVPPGECGQFKIFFEVSCDASLGQVHCSQVHALPDTICPGWTGARLRLTGGCTGTEAFATIHNDGGNMASPLKYFWTKWTDFDANETGSGTFQLAAGASQTVALPVNGQQIHFWVEKPAGYPFGEAARLDIQNCNASDPAFPVNVSSANFEDEPFFDEICLPNQGSFDPNDKQGFPAGLPGKGYIERTQSLEYLIRFQNTGTDTAFTVVVRDTLSPWLDPATLRLGASSHPCEMQLSGTGNLTFRFDQILLPDSNINEAASHGFVSFTISQHPGNADGTEIKNRAGIYFDFNEPVLTNTTRHTVGIPEVVGTKEPKAKPALLLAPNPFSEELTVQLENVAGSGGKFSFRLLDVTGKVVDTGDFSGEQFTYRNGRLAEGFYLLEIRAENGKLAAAGKVVKQ